MKSIKEQMAEALAKSYANKGVIAQQVRDVLKEIERDENGRFAGGGGGGSHSERATESAQRAQETSDKGFTTQARDHHEAAASAHDAAAREATAAGDQTSARLHSDASDRHREAAAAQDKRLDAAFGRGGVDSKAYARAEATAKEKTASANQTSAIVANRTKS